jgi:D-alanine-D-alanine ligase
MERTKVGVIFGGRSGEHEISVRSATTVVTKIDRERFEVVPIAITNEGRWLGPSEAAAMLPASARDCLEAPGGPYPAGDAMFSCDTGFQGLRILPTDGSSPVEVPLDVVFPVLHGTYGEDGTIQGLFEMSGIPYVGCGVLASSSGMDKVFMKTLFRDAGLPQCEYVWFLRREWEQNRESVISRIEETLGYPCFVKPANLGSSVGVSRASDADGLAAGIELAAAYDRKIIVEENLDMREIECAVIGNDDPEASLPGEYIVLDEEKKFLDYKEKYSGTGNNEFVVPARIPDELAGRLRGMAATAFKTVDGSGFARVDFFLRNDNGELLINEINTIPGLTDASGFPKMWEGTGLPFTSVIDRLIELAFERHADRAKNRTAL